MENIENVIKNNMENKYIKRVEKTFKYFDTDNCKRIYKEIKNIEVI